VWLPVAADAGTTKLVVKVPVRDTLVRGMPTAELSQRTWTMAPYVSDRPLTPTVWPGCAWRTPSVMAAVAVVPAAVLDERALAADIGEAGVAARPRSRTIRIVPNAPFRGTRLRQERPTGRAGRAASSIQRVPSQNMGTLHSAARLTQ
jgi:hypothetical protein